LEEPTDLGRLSFGRPEYGYPYGYPYGKSYGYPYGKSYGYFMVIWGFGRTPICEKVRRANREIKNRKPPIRLGVDRHSQRLERLSFVAVVIPLGPEDDTVTAHTYYRIQNTEYSLW